jgi:hypothetical protein
MPDTAIFKYVTATGAAGLVPGNDSNTYNLFSSVVAFQGARMAPQMGYKRLVVDIKNAGGNGTLKFYKSVDRGVNWLQIDEIAVTAPAANATNVYDFLIEEYDDFKLDWVNGGTIQNPWSVSIALTDSRNPMA